MPVSSALPFRTAGVSGLNAEVDCITSTVVAIRPDEQFRAELGPAVARRSLPYCPPYRCSAGLTFDRNAVSIALTPSTLDSCMVRYQIVVNRHEFYHGVVTHSSAQG